MGHRRSEINNKRDFSVIVDLDDNIFNDKFLIKFEYKILSILNQQSEKL